MKCAADVLRFGLYALHMSGTC